MDALYALGTVVADIGGLSPSSEKLAVKLEGALERGDMLTAADSVSAGAQRLTPWTLKSAILGGRPEAVLFALADRPLPRWFFFEKEMPELGFRVPPPVVQMAGFWRPEIRQSIPEILAILVEAGADIDARDENGCTLLHWACGWGGEFLFVVRALIRLGADVNARCDRGKTPIYAALYVWKKNDENLTALVVELADAGALLDVQDREGVDVLTFSLHCSAKWGFGFWTPIQFFDEEECPGEEDWDPQSFVLATLAKRNLLRPVALQRQCWFAAARAGLTVEGYLPPVVIAQNRRWAARNRWAGARLAPLPVEDDPILNWRPPER